MRDIIIITVITIITVILAPPAIHAINMNSNQYRIQFGNINMGAKDD